MPHVRGLPNSDRQAIRSIERVPGSHFPQLVEPMRTLVVVLCGISASDNKRCAPQLKSNSVRIAIAFDRGRGGRVITFRN
jgi:hypothetical protein